MGTHYRIDGRLARFIDISETFTDEFIEILNQNYKEKKLELGMYGNSNTNGFGVFFTVTDSEFEDVILKLMCRNTDYGTPYEINIEM